MTDITPEHTKRRSIDHATEGELHPDLVAAYAYVETVIDSSIDTTKPVLPYVWHGWSLREAFLAGASYQKEQTDKTRKAE